MVVGSGAGVLLELLLEAGRLRSECGNLRFNPLKAVVFGYQLFNCRLRASVFPHPSEGFFLYVSDRRLRIFSDVPLDISFEGCRVQSAGEGVLQHGVGEDVRLGGVGLRPQEAKAGDVLSNGLGEPLLLSKKRPSVSVFSPVLLEDVENLSTPMERISCLACSSSAPRSQPAATGSSIQLCLSMKSLAPPSSPENQRSL